MCVNIHVMVCVTLDDRTKSDFVSDMATSGSPGIDRQYLMSDIAQLTINVQPCVFVPRPDYLSAFVRWTHAGYCIADNQCATLCVGLMI